MQQKWPKKITRIGIYFKNSRPKGKTVSLLSFNSPLHPSFLPSSCNLECVSPQFKEKALNLQWDSRILAGDGLQRDLLAANTLSSRGMNTAVKGTGGSRLTACLPCKHRASFPCLFPHCTLKGSTDVGCGGHTIMAAPGRQRQVDFHQPGLHTRSQVLQCLC